MARRTGRVRRRHHQIHSADFGHVEFETLARAKPRSTDDLNLGQLVVPAADTVDRLRAEQVAAPEFPNPEFRSSGNRTNVSTVASPADTTAKTDRNRPGAMRTTGVPPLTREQLGGIRARTTILPRVRMGAGRDHDRGCRHDPRLRPRRPLRRRSGTKSPMSRPRTELTAYAGILASALSVALVLGAPWHSLALAGALLLACVPAGAAVMCWVDSGENGSQAGLTLTVSLAVVAIACTLMIWTTFWQPRALLFVLAFGGAASCAARLGWRADR